MNSESNVELQSPFREIQISDLKVNEDNINRNIIEELKKSINQVGLLNPIVINTKGILVTGRHRTMAMKELGYKTILAREIKFGQKEKRDLATIQENLARNVYLRLERARLVGRQAELLKQLGLASGHGGDRKTKMRNSQLEPVSRHIKNMTGQSERTISEDLQIHNGIPTSLDNIIYQSKISDSREDLLKIATAKTDKQKIAKELIKKAAQKASAASGKKPPPNKLSVYKILKKSSNLFKSAILQLKEGSGRKNAKKSHELLQIVKEIENQIKEAADIVSGLKEKLQD